MFLGLLDEVVTLLDLLLQVHDLLVQVGLLSEVYFHKLESILEDVGMEPLDRGALALFG